MSLEAVVILSVVILAIGWVIDRHWRGVAR